jgi:transposase-like protein
MEKKERKHYSAGFKEQVIRRMQAGERVKALSHEFQIAPSVLFSWRQAAKERPGGEKYEASKRQRAGEEQALEARDRRVRGGGGTHHAGTGFFGRCLAKNRGDHPGQRKRWQENVWAEIRGQMESQGELSLLRMCGLAEISRASFYRQWERQAIQSLDQELCDAIQPTSLAHRFYGYRRIAQVLRRQGRPVNAKKVRRLMHEDNLLANRKRKFVATTDSDHDFRVYPNLAKNLKLSDVNQFWGIRRSVPADAGDDLLLHQRAGS